MVPLTTTPPNRPKSKRTASSSSSSLLLASILLYKISSSQTLSLSTTTPPSSSSSSSSSLPKNNNPFASKSPIAFGTLNPAYDETPTTGLANLLNSLPDGTLIDTAEKYGTDDGDAERELGSALQFCGRTFQKVNDDDESNDDNNNNDNNNSNKSNNNNTPDLLLCSKFAPKPWRTSPDSVVQACRSSMERLGVNSIFLYQLHYSDAISQPFKIFGYVDNKDEIYWEGLERCYHEGLIEHVGVCNYGPQNTRAAHAFFAKRNVPLASNQINFNLMRHRSSMETKSVCDELGIQVFGYHPLGGGVLTGAYDDEWFRNTPGGFNKRKSKSTRVRWYQKKCAPVIHAVRDVAIRRGKTPAQVAINWCICKGIVPICGARDVGQVMEAVGGGGGMGEEEEGNCWRLGEMEVEELDEASAASAEYARGFELI